MTALPTQTMNQRTRHGLLLAVAVLGAASLGSQAIPEGREFGEGVTMSEVTTLDQIMSDPDSFDDKSIVVSGRISDVCQKKGCWTVLSDGKHTMRVRFKDYGFFVPKDSRGKTAYVEGVVQVVTLSERDARHYAAESIGEDPSKIDGPQREVGFMASGVRIIARKPAEK